MTTPEAVALYGVRCGKPEVHHSDGRIYATSPHRFEMASLAKNTCFELLVSNDSGNTWESYTQEGVSP